MRHIIHRGLAVGLILSLFVMPFLAAQVQAAQAKAAQQTQAKQAPAEKININTASLDELQKLPRVGPKVAQRIVDFRKQNGAFKKIEEIMKVRGIGEKVFAGMKDWLTI